MRRGCLLGIVAAMLCCSLAANMRSAAAQGAQAANDVGTSQFHWPGGHRAAVSLSFDDARTSQIDVGLPLLQKLGVKVTFFVEPRGVRERLAGWRQAVADGHEIANHSLTHPCTGNYAFSRNNDLEDYDLKRMAQQLDGANGQIESLLGVKPKDFAYPCGQKFVGRGLDTESYVPLVAERFLVGRGYLDESPNDPTVVDLPRAMGTSFDDMDFAQMKKIVDQAAREGRWVIFVGHNIGQRAFQTTDTKALADLCAYLKDPANGIWLGTVAEIGTYVREQRAGKK
ncbi:MAG: polysaccharide deacetylase family protein [Acidobacteriota bacterium]|nr:polysaccharide deacetylase family protein [Acidobacteriota bacterium]